MRARVPMLLCLVAVGCSGRIGGGAGDDAALGGAPDGAPGTPDAAGTQPQPDADLSHPDAAPGAPDGGPAAPTRGATLPYVEYEAEAGSTNGTTIGPSRSFGDFAAESSGRRAVRLDATGQFVSFVTTKPANSIVVRYVIPDAPGGGGIDATISLLVDGVFRQELALTSRYAWTYGGEEDSASNDPGDGGAHHFYDETRALVGAIPAGATVELRRESDDSAAFVIVDLVDLEQVAPPLTQPAGSLSITDFGATADDASDDGSAIANAIAAARTQGKVLWIPAGTFRSAATPWNVAELTIRGAGMWYSTLRGAGARFTCVGNRCRFADFAILGETTARDEASLDNGFYGAAGSGSRLDNIWVEHTKVGYWVGSGATDGLVIHGCRFRNLFADGVNLCNGASHSVVEESHARNTGDDAFAAWSPSFDGTVDTGNVFRFDTVQLPWRANCFAVYGGQDNTLEDSTCADVVMYPGVLIAQQFTSFPFAGTTTVQRVTLTRAGGPMYGQQHGALKLHGAEGPVAGVHVQDVDIVDATYSGIEVQGPGRVDGVLLEDVTIDHPGSFGLQVTADAQGTASTRGVVVTSPGAGGLQDDAAGWTFSHGAGDSGW